MRTLMSVALVLVVAAAGCRQTPAAKQPSPNVPITAPSESRPPPTSAPAEAEDISAGEIAASEPAAAPAAPPLRPPLAEAKGSATPQLVGGAILQVNGRFFSVDDIVNAAGLELGKIPPGLPEEAFRRRAEQVINDTIRRQVSQALVLPEADKILTEEQTKLIDQEVARTLDEMVLRAGGSKKKLELDLQSQGTTLQNILDDFRSDLKVRLLLRMKFMPAISISRSMLWDYYRRNRDQFATPPKVQMQIISVPLSTFLAEGAGEPTAAERAAAAAKARQRIEQARTALGQGEDFGSVADRYSFGMKAGSGGLWPPMPAGSFRQEKVEKVAFSQEKGQVSDIIETDEGYFIVKTADVQKGSSVSFEDAQVQIEKTLRDQQSAKLYNEYYEKLLWSATIVQSENFVPLAVERAVARYRGR